VYCNIKNHLVGPSLSLKSNSGLVISALIDEIGLHCVSHVICCLFKVKFTEAVVRVKFNSIAYTSSPFIALFKLSTMNSRCLTNRTFVHH